MAKKNKIPEHEAKDERKAIQKALNETEAPTKAEIHHDDEATEQPDQPAAPPGARRDVKSSR